MGDVLDDLNRPVPVDLTLAYSVDRTWGNVRADANGEIVPSDHRKMHRPNPADHALAACSRRVLLNTGSEAGTAPGNLPAGVACLRCFPRPGPVAAEDHQARAVALLTEHGLDVRLPSGDEVCLCGARVPDQAAHQGAVLVAEHLVPTRTEWGVQLRTMLDGPFDRTLTLSEYSRPYTRDQARSEAEQMARGQHRAERFADGKPGARLVARGLTGWHETT